MLIGVKQHLCRLVQSNTYCKFSQTPPLLLLCISDFFCKIFLVKCLDYVVKLLTILKHVNLFEAQTFYMATKQPGVSVFLTLRLLLFCLIRFFTSHQQSFSYIGTGLPGLNQY